MNEAQMQAFITQANKDSEERFRQMLDTITELLSDKKGSLTELAKGRAELSEWLGKASFNAGGNDANGNYTKLDIVNEHIEKLDNLLIKLGA